jgi:hypothetical protein
VSLCQSIDLFSFIIQLFQQHDDSRNSVVSFTDKLGMDGFLEPYRRQFDKKDRNKVFAYRVKPEYKNYNLEQLDPLKRFTFSEMTKEECFFQEWFLIGDNNDASFEGIFMEAGLACHALQNEMCHSCKYRTEG